MKWLKYKIKNWLREEVFKEELGSIKSMKLQCKNTLNEVNEMKSLYQQITNIGVDVDCHDKNSWAIVCIDGHPEYIKFVDLKGSEARDIENFLRRFEKSNVVVDSPFRINCLNHIKGYELW